MKKILIITVLSVVVGIMAGPTASADSFNLYFGNGAWRFNMNFGNYEYYNRYSPGFYDSGNLDFYAALAPYGSWQYMSEFNGMVWIPFVPVGWRPYSYGAWCYTSYGWTWTAYEPWGWIPHHYGNWLFYPGFGWIWIPGYTWAPAHVTWGFFNGYYGWAPMPPRYSAYYSSYHHRDGYRRNRGYHWYSRSSSRQGYHAAGGEQNTGSFDQYEWIPNEAWVIVSSAQFMSDNISEVAVKPDDNMYVFSNRSFKLHGEAPTKSVIERDTRRSIAFTQVDEVSKTVDGNKIKVVRPQKMDAERSRKIGNVYQSFTPDAIQQTRSRQQIPVTGRPDPYVQTPSDPQKDSLNHWSEQPQQPSAPNPYTQPTPYRPNQPNSSIQQPFSRPPTSQPPRMQQPHPPIPTQPKAPPQLNQPPQPKTPPKHQTPPGQNLKPPSNTTGQNQPGKQIEPSGKQKKQPVDPPKQQKKKKVEPTQDDPLDANAQGKNQGVLNSN